MDPLILRKLWMQIESAHTHTLLNLDDTGLVQWLIQETQVSYPLSADEKGTLAAYLYSKLSLIRDIADQRLAA
ncbi:MAG: hypothetical protein ACTS2F_02710 [Thainema sp.]